MNLNINAILYIFATHFINFNQIFDFMKSRFSILIASLLMCASAFAQWTKPALPASTPLEVGKECYLFNKDAGGFLVGANDYGTRASVSATLGHKVYIEQGTADGSYYISDYVLSGWRD